LKRRSKKFSDPNFHQFSIFTNFHDAEEELLAQLRPIELHHCEYSADPAYSILEVVGCAASAKVRDALASFGFTIEESSPNGFRAIHAST
jgi:hypothetical protein